MTLFRKRRIKRMIHLVGKRHSRLIERACITAIRDNPLSPLKLMYCIRAAGIASRYGFDPGKIIMEKLESSSNWKPENVL